MITYAEPGLHLYLKEIVFAGSHDAGITGGKGNTQTQSLNICKQAKAGARMFDLRINAASVGWSVAELKSYHAGGGIIKKQRLPNAAGHQAERKHRPVKAAGRRFRAWPERDA